MKKAHQNKDFKIMRGVSLWLHDNRCAVIGCSAQAAQVHHDDRINTNNKLQNLVPLCAKCHFLIHKTNQRFNFANRRFVVLLLKKISHFHSR